MDIKKYLSEKIEKVLLKLGYDTKYSVVAFCNNDLADLQCNCSFALAKIAHKSPMLIAQEIVYNLATEVSEQFDVSIVNGFINFKLTDKFLSQIANDCAASDRLNIAKVDKPINLFIDYGGANVAKPLHVGHMRSAIVGEAIKKLNIFLGNNVTSDVHLGDWGLQMGLVIAQLIDDYDMGYYFGKAVPKVDITMAMLDVAYPKASLRKKDEPDFYNRASEITLKLQQKVSGYYDIWLEMNKVCIEMVKASYLALGVTFDLWNGESSVNDLVPYVLDYLEQKHMVKISEGAKIVEVAEEGETQPMPPLLLLKSNGAQMYPITEIATIVDRAKVYHPDEILYITDNRQTLHFQQVFRVVRKSGIVDDSIGLKHITFGTVNGKDGKPFKTRDGGTFKLDDLIAMVTDKALEKLRENKVDVPNITELSKMIGISALIFGDLSNVISRDYIFDLDKFMTFEGKTGPYLQYTAVRIKSILNKSDYTPMPINITAETRDIMINILKLIDSFDQAYKENSLHSICLALYELCSTFSNFYNNVKILATEDYLTRQNYLNILQLVYKAIDLGCGILGIKIPAKM